MPVTIPAQPERTCCTYQDLRKYQGDPHLTKLSPREFLQTYFCSHCGQPWWIASGANFDQRLYLTLQRTPQE